MSGTNPIRRAVWPAYPAGARPSVLTTVRRVVAGLWLTVSTVLITIWLLILVIGGNLVAPFWLWSLGAGAILVAALWLVAEQLGRVR